MFIEHLVQRLPFWARLGLFAAANFCACIIGLALTPGPSRVALFWPAAGLVVGALLVTERRRWAAILVAASLPIAAFNVAAGQSLTVVVTFALGNVLAALGAAHLTLRWCSGRPRFAEIGHVLAFVLAGPLLATSCFEIPSAAILAIRHGYPFFEIWVGLWAGSGLGLLTVGSVVVAWSARRRYPAAIDATVVTERGAFTVLFALALAAVFLPPAGFGPFRHESWLLPFLVWAALRFGIRGATAIGVVMTLVALASTVAGRGVFAHPGARMESAVASQVFCAIAFLTALFLASAFEMHRAAQERLRHSEKLEAVGRLAGGIAHDFNNQLTVILGSAEHLHEALRADPGLHDIAATIRGGALRSARLVSQLLAFSRKVPPRATEVDVHAMIDEVLALLSRSIDKRIELRDDRRASRGVVRGDPDRLSSAFLNLALNARDAMPGGGTLTFATRDAAVDRARARLLEPFEIEPGSYVEISVRDTGVGLTDEARAHLFEPYFTTKEVGKGSGLGLPEVYGTVQAHHGAVSVESAPGRGTAFTLLLPAAADAPRGSELIENPVPERAPDRSRLRVLVVDDEKNVRLSLGILLRSHGHEVLEFAGGRDATAWYVTHPSAIDAAIIDVMMPDMTGAELVSRLRAIRPGVPIIISSGYTADADGAFSAEPGVHFLPKPYTLEQLDRVLDAAAKPSPAAGPRAPRP